MPAPIAYNLITFRLAAWTGEDAEWIYLTGGAITRRGGLEPDLWTFTVPYTELEKLSGLADVEVEIEGVLELWYSYHPEDAEPADVTLGNVAIINIEPDLIGREPGDTADKILTYQLTISDHRRAFVEPRGGRLFDGLLNPDPAPDGYTLYLNSDLMLKCATAMGVSVTIGGDVDDADPLRECDYNGAHAPGALQELLEHTGHVYAPLISGQAQIMQPGTGSGVTVPTGRTINLLTSKSIDRRPAEVIFTSAPQAKVHTFNASAGEAAPAWRYVIQDPADDQWKPLTDVSALTAAGGAAAVWTSEFGLLAETDRARIREQLYCCIQLDPDVYPPERCNLLPKAIDTDLVQTAPRFEAIDGLVTQRSDGSFGAHNDEAALLARQVVPEANVLVFPHPLVELIDADADVTQLNGANSTPFPIADLLPTFSVEAWDAPEERKEFATYGFGVSGVSVTTMSESAAKDKLTGYRPSVAILESPDLVQVILNPGSGSPVTNRDTMEDRATTYARNVLRLGTPAMQVLTVKGFLAVELDGVVSEVTYDPQTVTTIVTLNGWHVTSRCGGDSIDTGGSGISRNVTRQRSRSRPAARKRSQRQTTRLGVDGTGKLVEPSRPQTREFTWPRLHLVTGATPISGMKGRYTGSFLTWAPAAGATGALATSNIGASTGECEIWHPPDESADDPTLESTDVLLAIEGPRHTSRDKTIMITASSRGGAGGSSGIWLKVTAVASTYLTAKAWDGSTTSGDDILVLPIQGHAVNDLIYAVKSSNGTSVTSPTVTHVELLATEPSTDLYKVVQVIDSTGRLDLDWVRAH